MTKLRNCHECGATLHDENMNTKSQTISLSGRPDATEEFVTGYVCPACGNRWGDEQ